MPNPYTVLDPSTSATMLIALSGYPQDQLCEEFGQIEDAFLSHFKGRQYPQWYCSLQIEICHLIARYIPTDHLRLIYVPWTEDALRIEQGPAFFRSDETLIAIAECLAQYGNKLHWSRQHRSLEVTVLKSD